MYFILAIAAVVTGVTTFFSIKNDDDFVSGLTFLLWLGLIIIGMAIPMSYMKENNLIEQVAAQQETINEIINDGASDREKAQLVETILNTNREIKELQLDNAGWMWALETPDSVDKIKPLEMICTCP